MSTSGFDSSARGPAGGSNEMLEFACQTCGRMLKVPSFAVGKQAKCPQCGIIQTVPSGTSASPVEASLSDGSEAGRGSSSPGSFGASNSLNPSPPAGSLAGAPPAASPKPFVATSAPYGDAATSFPSRSSPAGSSPGVPVASTGPMVQPVAPPLGATSASSPFDAGWQPSRFETRPVEKRPANQLSLDTSLREHRGAAGSDTPTRQLFERITGEIAKLYVGQDELVLGTLVALFSSGHVLIESVPGLGKTLFVRTLGRVLGCRFGRIQFTADLMPSDITGAPIFDMKVQEFRFRPGPVFTQLLLADEINRSPAKTHAALLEIMQEYRVTIDGTSHHIERPFLVLATQNPIESEGTYNLPEAQLDRFMFKLFADYPGEQDEAAILRMHGGQQDLNRRLEETVQTVTSPAEIMQITQENSRIRVDDKLIDYINKIVRLTRRWPQFHMGASPRAGIALVQGARTLAAFAGRDYAVPDDVVQIVLPALRHRVILTAESEVEGRRVDELLTELVRTVEVPRI
jgi:MoxR-like ATPase